MAIQSVNPNQFNTQLCPALKLGKVEIGLLTTEDIYVVCRLFHENPTFSVVTQVVSSTLQNLLNRSFQKVDLNQSNRAKSLKRNLLRKMYTKKENLTERTFILLNPTTQIQKTQTKV